MDTKTLYEQDPDAVCVYDLCSQSGRFPTSYWADWSKKLGIIVFGGDWTDVPPMTSDTEPTELEVQQFAMHWIELSLATSGNNPTQ